MFNFHLFNRDEDFDLLSGTLPGTLHFLFGDQLERARAVLSGRDVDEVTYAIECLDWMLHLGSQHLFDESMAALKQNDHHFVNRVKALRAYRSNFDITGQRNLPNALWGDYFAALTLACITEALYLTQHAAPGENPFLIDLRPTQSDNPDSGINWASALEAMDAVCFAEHLKSEANAEIAPIPKKAESGRKGGQIRASKFSDLKDKVFDLYKNKYHTSPSNREAARRILLELTKEDLSVLRTDDPKNRLQKWIGEYKKRLNKKPDPQFL